VSKVIHVCGIYMCPVRLAFDPNNFAFERQKQVLQVIRNRASSCQVSVSTHHNTAVVSSTQVPSRRETPKCKLVRKQPPSQYHVIGSRV
jgi:hypothetical protein